MKLTDKEIEIMTVLWGSKTPMTAVEIIEASNDSTWKEGSIYGIMKSLIKKGAAVLAMYKPTSSKNAMAYSAAITSEEYTISYIKQTGMQIDVETLIDRLLEAEEA